MNNKQKILLIESDPILFKTLMNILKAEEFDIDGVNTVEGAEEIAKNKVFDLIVAEINLPGNIDGVDAVKKIKEIRPDFKTSVIFMGIRIDAETPARVIKLGADDYLCRPFDLEYFLHSVKRSLKMRELEEQKLRYLEEIKKIKEQLEVSNAKLEEKVEERTKKLMLLLDIGRQIISSLKLTDVLNAIVQETADVLDIEICSIFLLDESKDEIFIAAAKGLTQDVISGVRMKRGEKISGWILENKKPVLVEDIEKDNIFVKRNEEKYYTGSFISAPLIFKEKAIGVINVSNKRSREIFNKDDLRLVEGIADYASAAIENAQLYSDLQGVYLQIVSTLNSIIELKDHYTKKHSQRVTQYAVAVAKSMGITSPKIEALKLACQLHDLGKIGIDEAILTKPDKLTEEEWGKIKLHPEKGVEILQPLKFLNEVMMLIVQHHERYDGKGYPHGYRAQDIDLGARIIAVADSFDAMTTQRPYAKAFTLQEAVEELKRCEGTQFDPQVVEAFIKMLEENRDLLEDR